jgi:hypothetical protein
VTKIQVNKKTWDALTAMLHEPKIQQLIGERIATVSVPPRHVASMLFGHQARVFVDELNHWPTWYSWPRLPAAVADLDVVLREQGKIYR